MKAAACIAGAGLLLAIGGPAAAQEATRQFRSLAAGETVDLFGARVAAPEAAKAVFSLSSELVAVAVIEGSVTEDGLPARAGEVLVAPVDGGKVRRFRFDARRLAATLPPEWAREAEAPLRQIAERQQRLRFWGMLEPVNLNVSAPVRPDLEPVRQSYLGSDVVARLRREAGGDPAKLAGLTARRFAAALAAGDAATAAELLDPKPFTDTGADANAWRDARLAFAGRLVADRALAGAMASEPAAVAGDQTAFDAGGYRIHLMPRDRALFVTTVEKL